MKLKINMCPLDRLVRILIGGILVYLAFFTETFISSNVLRSVLGVIGLVNIASAMLGFCIVYTLANISTLKRQENESSLLEKQN